MPFEARKNQSSRFVFLDRRMRRVNAFAWP
nr:MAG TPA: hypothetical protein [Caudoviricetes sp.]DAV20672.1 MAG TPA: hypothetical protein [Bacteriophage sp.]